MADASALAPPPGLSAQTASSPYRLSTGINASAASGSDDSRKRRATEDPDLSAEKPCAITKVLGKLPRDVLMNIKSVVTTLESKLQKMLNVNERLQKTKDKIEMINKDTLPPGVRPFKLPVNVKEYDELLPSQLSRGLDIKFKPGTTIRKAREIVHIQVAKFQLLCEEEVLKHELTNARPFLDKTTFLNNCCQTSVEQSSEVAALRSLLGLPTDEEDQQESLNQVTRAKASQLYAEVFEAAAKKRAADRKKTEDAQKALKKKLPRLWPQRLNNALRTPCRALLRVRSDATSIGLRLLLEGLLQRKKRRKW